jgi:hypothetical protein
MNPFKSLRNYFIGGVLAKTDDVFEQVKAEVLFNFASIFIIANLPYLIASSHIPVLLALGLSSLAALIICLIMLKKTSNVKTATYFFLTNFTLQSFGHYIISNGEPSVPGALFFLLFALCGFLLMDRAWGFGISIMIVFGFLLGIYNQDHVLFSVPPEMAHPKETGFVRYLAVIPMILNLYLISEFVKAKQKAEKQLSERKKTIEEKQKEIVDSIHYAKRIQKTLMPTDKYLDKEMNRLQKK